MPKVIEIETTTLCDRRCVICEYVYWKKGEQVRRHLTFEEFKEMIDQFPVIRWSNVTGEGSAFLNPDYIKMLKYLHGKGASVWLVDHLDSIPWETLRDEVLPYIHGMYVSMDGATRQTYEKIKVGCNYDNVIQNLLRIIGYKRTHRTPFPHLTFRYVITKDNVEEIPAFLSLLNTLAEPHEWGGSSSRVEFTGLLTFPEIEQYEVKKVPQDVLDVLRQMANPKKLSRCIPFSFNHPEQRRNPPMHRCLAWREPYVMLPGYVIPCCAVLMSNNRPLLRKCSFGNLLKGDMVEIWYSPKYEVFRKLIVDEEAPVPEICVGCRAFQTKERIEQNGIWMMQGDVDE